MTINIRRVLFAAGSCLTLFAGTVGAAAAAPPASPAAKTVTYLGHRFTVPADWPVIDLAADPSACVRFDRHALYLGAPSDGASCPAGGNGRSEAVLVEPAAAGSSPGGTADAMDRVITVTAEGLRVTGAYDLDERLVRRII